MSNYGDIQNVTDTNAIGSVPTSSLFTIAIKLATFATPIIVAIGVVGNLLSAVIFFGKRLRKTSCSLYLAARAISDTGFLLCLLILWLDTVGMRVFNTVPMCQITLFLTYVCGFLSVWFVVFVTIENYFRVCKPFSVQKFCTLKWARLLIVIWIALACVFYNQALWINHVARGSSNASNMTSCRPKDHFALIHSIVANGDTIITFLLPSVIILGLMGSITYCIIVTYRERNANLNRGSADLQTKVTRMLFWVSFVFLVLNLPSHTIRIVLLIRGLVSHSTNHISPAEYFTQQLLQFVYYLSFVVNFIVYIALGDSFRKTFVRKFCRCLPTLSEDYRPVPTQLTQMTPDPPKSGICSRRNSPVTVTNGRLAPPSPRTAQKCHDRKV